MSGGARGTRGQSQQQQAPAPVDPIINKILTNVPNTIQA